MTHRRPAQAVTQNPRARRHFHSCPAIGESQPQAHGSVQPSLGLSSHIADMHEQHLPGRLTSHRAEISSAGLRRQSEERERDRVRKQKKQALLKEIPTYGYVEPLPWTHPTSAVPLTGHPKSTRSMTRRRELDVSRNCAR